MPDRTWTDPRVLTRGVARGWADPETDPAQIDWPARQARAAIAFTVRDGHPVNPCETTAIRYGRNKLGRWGENLAGDALVTVSLYGQGTRLLMIERRDGGGWAVPGGFVNQGEPAPAAALRELAEEAGLSVSPGTGRVLPARYSPDSRASGEAWIVTVPVHVDLGARRALPDLVPDPAEVLDARWIPADSYELLTAALRREHEGRVFAPHHAMLTEFLGAQSRRTAPSWSAADYHGPEIEL